MPQSSFVQERWDLHDHCDAAQCHPSVVISQDVLLLRPAKWEGPVDMVVTLVGRQSLLCGV